MYTYMYNIYYDVTYYIVIIIYYNIYNVYSYNNIQYTM